MLLGSQQSTSLPCLGHNQYLLSLNVHVVWLAYMLPRAAILLGTQNAAAYAFVPLMRPL